MPNETMVRVKLNCSRAGHLFDDKGRFCGEFSQAAGDVVSMPQTEAQRHIQRGLATRVSDKE